MPPAAHSPRKSNLPPAPAMPPSSASASTLSTLSPPRDRRRNPQAGTANPPPHRHPFHLLCAASPHLTTRINDSIRHFLQTSAAERGIDHFSTTFRIPLHHLPSASGIVFAPKVLANGADMLAFCDAESDFVWFLWAGERLGGRAGLEAFLQGMVKSGEIVHCGEWARSMPNPDGFGGEEWTESLWHRFLGLCWRAKMEAETAAGNRGVETQRQTWVRVVPYRFLKGQEADADGEENPPQHIPKSSHDFNYGLGKAGKTPSSESQRVAVEIEEREEARKERLRREERRI
ncbi:hypothetical protein H2199_007135 [Coniosporium tulheliwenetii]|uniref:Uncharacterized protein n=1 Tax=Coniosporium tulheliwenetii TaxID=3383036 RepID=A0ACC2YT18_9PEZI|nr:hypothetical protein H2199_007135 [Cladosporium sp. JES 115]